MSLAWHARDALVEEGVAYAIGGSQARKRIVDGYVGMLALPSMTKRELEPRDTGDSNTNCRP
eukprot:5841145-Pleurochrysis_carterae.AAC.2